MIKTLRANRVEVLVTVGVGALLLVYAFVRFFGVPYVGFHFTGTSGEVAGIFETLPVSDPFQIEDELVTVDGYPFEDYPVSLHDQLFLGKTEGDTSRLTVLRNGRLVNLDWELPGFNLPEFMSRLIGVWVVSFAFWAAGAATILLVRPHSRQRTLLAALNFITAIWIMAGSLSRTHAWESPFVMRAALWLSAPIYLQFHWSFPRPMRKLPDWVWWVLYIVFGAGAVAQWLSLLPILSYVWPFAIGILGSLLLLLVRLFWRAERRQVGLLFLAMFFAFVPALLPAFSPSFDLDNIALVGSLFALPILPGAYFYSIYRRQLAGLELRANRLISTYLFMVVLVAVVLGLMPFYFRSLGSIQTAAALTVGALILGILATAFGLRSFQSFVERRILSMPLPPENLLGAFSGQLATSLTRDHLVGVFSKQILPSLFIREAALLVVQEGEERAIVFSQGVADEAGKQLLEQEFELEKLSRPQEKLKGVPWAQLVLPLQVSERLVGVLVLGRKDPDDYYSQAEVNTLQAIADQTAIALVNITQAQRLRALHQADIAREEAERGNLARDLHDDVLNRLGELGNRLADSGYSPDIEAGLQALSANLRSTVNDLRPPMLNLGMHAALMQLADDLSERPEVPEISMLVPATSALYPPEVEQHLFRIVQQACENTLRHAGARRLTISGQLDSDAIRLTIQDDGRGFEAANGIDLLELLGAHHFGLAGMFERAELIGANLRLFSSPSRGTEISIVWQAD